MASPRPVAPDASQPRGVLTQPPARSLRARPSPLADVLSGAPSRLVLAAIAAVAAMQASAIGLGTPELNSGLGEPLRLSLPVTAQSDEEIGCIQVRARGNDLPSVFNTRSSVVRARGGTRIEITSAQSVGEPAIGLVVSVGCQSPVAREFNVFLDPPIAPVLAVAAGGPVRSVVEPRIPRGAATPRVSSAVGVGGGDDAAAAASPPRRVAPRRPPRPRPPAPSTGTGSAPAAASTAAAPPPTTSAAPPARDRLSVVPTEPGAAGSAGGPATVPPTTDASAGTTPAPAPSVAPAADPDALAREEALRRQQAALEAQIKALGDQIAALNAQTAALAARNQALEEHASQTTLIWPLVALAVVALAIAAWMASRYGRLRRSLEGTPWWTGQTVQAPVTVAAANDREGETQFAPLDAGTRIGTRPLVRTDAAQTTPSGVAADADRSRPAGRSGGYASAIQTDFTVSDIEAAMATVRTVSAPKKAPPPPLQDSDFGTLGGPTLPSPFADPPPAKAVDLDIPPLAMPSAAPTPVSAPPMSSSSAGRTRPLSATGFRPTEVEPPAPLDLRLDLPTAFDPLATDAHKRTVVDQKMVDAALTNTPTSLDLELPSATMIEAMTTDDLRGTSPADGSTALRKLFTSDTGPLGPDTILQLDDRHGAPLTPTEVDRLAPSDDGADAGTPDRMQARLARFAELIGEVDEAAATDPLRAIAQLRQFVLRDDDIPTLFWLRLFELYKAVDKRMVYDALNEHFARRYHRPMVGWDEKLADRVPQSPLSSFGELDREIEASWGSAAGIERLQSLVCGRDQPEAIVFNATLQRDLLDAAKVFLLDRDSSIARRG